MDVDGALEDAPRRAGFHVRDDHVNQFPGLVPNERGAEDRVRVRIDDQAEEAVLQRPLRRRARRR